MEGCYWIALKDGRARTDCAKYIFLTDQNVDKKESLKKYEGQRCPFCGKVIFTDERSYELLDS